MSILIKVSNPWLGGFNDCALNSIYGRGRWFDLRWGRIRLEYEIGANSRSSETCVATDM
jgi:hypothetical protein